MKRMMRLLSIIAAFLGITIFAFWVIRNISYTTTVNGRQCIQPKLAAIPAEIPLVWDDKGGENPRWQTAREPIPAWMKPQLNWLQQRQIPAIFSPFSIVDIAISENIVWMAYDHFIARYDTSTHQLNTYNFDGLIPDLSINDLLVTKDHNLWVAGSRLDKRYPVLMRYNSEKNTFDDVNDIDGLLRPLGASIIGYYGRDRILKEAPNGDVLFIFRQQIYSYNLLTNKAKIVLSGHEVTGIEADPRGMIWFTISDNDAVWMLDPDTNKLQHFDLPVQISRDYFKYGSVLYLDSHDRLWIPDWGFLDTSKKEYTWQVLKPDPLFVNIYDKYTVYDWDRADTIFEAQDGSIWFTSTMGAIRYDIHSQAACWISPQFGPIAEASDGSIWLLLQNQLYKYEPQK